MKPNSGNLFSNLPQDLLEEEFRPILDAPGLRIERIVSAGQATPAGEWLEQERAEWVVLLEGAAGLCFEAEAAERVLAPGDWVAIPARARHRVAWTDPDRPTVWLAIHYEKR